MRRRRVASWLAGGVVVLAACGSPTTTEPDAQPAVPATTEPITTGTAEPAAQPDATAAPNDAAPNATTAPAEPATTNEAASESTELAESADPEPITTTAAATTEPSTAVSESPAAMALDAGCSVDNTATDVADGPVPALAVRPESLSNPLPDVAVRQINCGGGWVNLKNAIPIDKPLLVWFWAPH